MLESARPTDKGSEATASTKSTISTLWKLLGAVFLGFAILASPSSNGEWFPYLLGFFLCALASVIGVMLYVLTASFRHSLASDREEPEAHE